MRITNQQINEFFQIGFLILPQVFSPLEIFALSTHLNDLQQVAEQFDKTTYSEGTRFVIENRAIQRVVWACSQTPELKNYAEDPRILIPVSQLLDSNEFNHLICQVHYKLPNDGVKFDWHQDSKHRRYGTDLWTDINQKGSYVQVVLAIDDTTVDSGPLQFCEGSCKLGHSDNPLASLNESKIVAPLLKSGDMVLFGPYTIHSSNPNTSNKPRRVFINGFSYPGANKRKYPGEGSGKLIKL